MCARQLLEVLYQLSEVSNDILGSAFFHFSALLVSVLLIP